MTSQVFMNDRLPRLRDDTAKLSFRSCGETTPQDRNESGASGHGEPLSLSRIREDPFEKQQVGKLQGDNTAQPKCAVCNRAVADDRWFCRIPRETKRIVLCCPCCALRNFETSDQKMNGHDRDFRTYERNLHFLVDGLKQHDAFSHRTKDCPSYFATSENSGRRARLRYT